MYSLNVDTPSMERNEGYVDLQAGVKELKELICA